MDINELRIALETDYGIQVYSGDLSEEELKRHGYRKMTGEEARHFDAIFQFAPHVVKDAYYARTFQDSFNAAVQGSYKVKIVQGLHLGKSHTTPGAFKGNAYDNNNILKTQADWIVNDAELNVSIAPQIASSVFSAAAFVTGQYFMTEINRNLSEIKTDTRDIKQFLENDKVGTIKAARDSLIRIIQHLKYIENDPDRRSRTLNKLDGIQDTANKYITVTQLEIEQEKATARNDDKSDAIKIHLNKVSCLLKQYQVLIGLYCQSKFLQIYLDNIRSMEDLALYQNELNGMVNDYFQIYNTFTVWTSMYLNENRSLNNRGVGQIMVSAGVGAVAGTVLSVLIRSLYGMTLSSSMSKSASDVMDTLRDDKKYRNEKYAESLLNSVSRYHYALKEPVLCLDKYIKAIRSGIEIIKIGDSVYTNLPE